MRDLGVTFDQFLNFDDHITAICRSTYFHIRNIGKIRNLYNACSTRSTIIHALISCRLDYCNSLLYNVPTLKIHKRVEHAVLAGYCAIYKYILLLKLIACKDFRINVHVY